MSADATLAERWRRAVRCVPDRPFPTFDDLQGGVTDSTYAECEAMVRRGAGGLSDRGVSPGSSVHLMVASSPAFVAVWLATTRLGAAIVPADPRSRTPELAEQIRRAAQ